MKKAGLIGMVVAAHVVLIGSVVLIQGCGTTPPPVQPAPPQVVMPPAVEPPPTPPPVEPAVVLPPPKVVEPAPSATKTYTVKAGDNLSLIAKRFNVSTRDLMKMNKITDANKLRVGQKLSLPGYVNLNAPAPAAAAHPKKKAPVAKKAPAAGQAPVAAAGEYVVKSGDTLGKIAHKAGTTVAAIKQANNLSSDSLKIGQKLVIGKGAAAEGAPAVAPAPAAPEGGTPAVEPGAAVGGAPLPEPKANEVLHVVEPNQDLNSIAMMYGVRTEDMMKLNNLATPEVKVGQTLKIPPPTE